MESLNSKVLTSNSNLNLNSINPKKDLIALISNLEEPKINLLRLSTSSSSSTTTTSTTANSSAWEWVYTNPTTTTKVNPLLKGKGKPISSGNEIINLNWNEEGKYLAVLTSNSKSKPSSTTSTTSSTIQSNLTILNVNNGNKILNSILIPTNSKITFLNWTDLTEFTSDSKLSSYVSKIILKLPTLPTLTKSSTSTSTTTGNVVVAASGVFGSAKNAALLREREKEAGRILNLNTSAPKFPILLEVPSSGSGGAGKNSILIIGDSNGKIHLYLGGSVFLGSFSISDESSIVSATILPSSPSATTATTSSTKNSTEIKISLLLSSPSKLSSKTLTISLPNSLEILTQQSTNLKLKLEHAFEALQEVKVLWDESRRIGKVWMARLDELGGFHGGTTPPTSQLLLLLLTGRHSRSLHDFLTAKINERGLNKWELTTTNALEKLKNVMFMSVAPAIEQVIMYLEEVKAWSIWPEKFSKFNLNTSELTKLIKLASEIIILSVQVETLTLEEERCFQSFISWLHYELEKISLQEGSDIRPLAKFQPIPVAHYILHCLPSSPITPYLNFGPSLAPLEENPDLGLIKGWFENLDLGGDAGEGGEKGEGEGKEGWEEGEGREELLEFMRGLVGDIKGQTSSKSKSKSNPKSKDGELGEDEMDQSSPSSPCPPSSEDDDEPPPYIRPSPSPTTAIPILLHYLSETLSSLLENSLQRIGDDSALSEEVLLSEYNGGTAEGEEGRGWRERVVVEGKGEGEVLYQVWIEGCVLRILKTPLSTSTIPTTTSTTDSTANGCSVEFPNCEVLELDFLSDEGELILLLKGTPTATTTTPAYQLLTLSLFSLPFQPFQPFQPFTSSNPTIKFTPTTTSSSSSPTSAFEYKIHTLDGQFAPQSFALSNSKIDGTGNGRTGNGNGGKRGKGRGLICILGGEGRRLEVLRVGGDEREEEVGMEE